MGISYPGGHLAHLRDRVTEVVFCNPATHYSRTAISASEPTRETSMKIQLTITRRCAQCRARRAFVPQGRWGWACPDGHPLRLSRRDAQRLKRRIDAIVTRSIRRVG